jgi:hypothetical protein
MSQHRRSARERMDSQKFKDPLPDINLHTGGQQRAHIYISRKEQRSSWFQETLLNRHMWCFLPCPTFLEGKFRDHQSKAKSYVGDEIEKALDPKIVGASGVSALHSW